MSLEEQERRRRRSFCISHHFQSAASRTPDKIAVVHAGGGASLSDLDRARISSSPPVYEGDECFTYADILSDVDSFSRRIRRVLDGGGDHDFVRPKHPVHVNPGTPAMGHGDNDMRHSRPDTDEVPSFSGDPRIVGVYIAPSVEYIVAVL